MTNERPDAGSHEARDDGYELSPEDLAARGEAAGGASESGGKAKIDAESLLSGFDEDADFEKDPVVEAVVKGPRIEHDEHDGTRGEKDEYPPLCDEGWPGVKTLSVVGALLAIVAIVLVFRDAESKQFTRAVLMAYGIAVHTGLGTVAVVIAAHFAPRHVGNMGVAAARMFVAVSALAAVYSTNMLLEAKIEESVLGLLAYAGVLLATFRTEPRVLGILAGAHGGLWLIVWLGQVLSASVGSG
ncbi:MAG: hypothetical protein RBS39_10985 [Phycisphaerales bacterium]|jgi:hypothetical protein|nr:hypothetical protein [Phycisphaerales bacterium]